MLADEYFYEEAMDLGFSHNEAERYAEEAVDHQAAVRLSERRHEEEQEEAFGANPSEEYWKDADPADFLY